VWELIAGVYIPGIAFYPPIKLSGPVHGVVLFKNNNKFFHHSVVLVLHQTVQLLPLAAADC